MNNVVEAITEQEFYMPVSPEVGIRRETLTREKNSTFLVFVLGREN